MYRNIAVVLALALLGGPAHAQAAGGPTPFEYQYAFPAGEACAFPVGVTGTGRVKYISLSRHRLFTVFGNGLTTITNLAEPAKSISLRGGGAWHDVVAADGSILGSMSGQSYVIGGSFGVSLYVGNYTVAVDAQGNLTSPPVGHGRIVQTCDLIS